MQVYNCDNCCFYFRKKTVLEIPFVSDEHEGNYSCVGTNFKDTPAVNQFKLELEGKFHSVKLLGHPETTLEKFFQT